MREFSYSCDQVCQMGYFEAYRLWFILDELKARDLQQFALILDLPHTTTDYRENILGWLRDRQPRRLGPSESIPEEVLTKFAEEFNRGRG